MISDVLTDAVQQMDRLTKDPIFSARYNELEAARRILNVRDSMRSLSAFLRAAQPPG
jgi:hypothetical protein